MKKGQNKSMKEMKNSFSQVKTPVDHLTNKMDQISKQRFAPGR